LGAFPGEHPLFLGMLGMHGTAYANLAVSHCDLLIAVGARFDDRVTGAIGKFAPKARIIHIDIDPAEIGKNISPDIPIVGDARNVLLELLQRVSDKEHSEWMKQLDAWKNRHPLKSQHMWEQLLDDDGPIHPQVVIDQLYELSGGKAVVTTDVGQHQMWTAQFFHFQSPRQLITSGGLGTMGFGFPAAIGAQIGCPEAYVIDIAGDGSIQMNIQELCTAVEQKLPVIICILNNQYLGMVRQWQELFYDKRYSYTDISIQPDFVRLAEAYGAVGMRVSRVEEVEPALNRALKIRDCPVVIDFRVEREANVFPMVPPGESLHNMLGGEG